GSILPPGRRLVNPRCRRFRLSHAGSPPASPLRVPLVHPLDAVRPCSLFPVSSHSTFDPPRDNTPHAVFPKECNNPGSLLLPAETPRKIEGCHESYSCGAGAATQEPT